MTWQPFQQVHGKGDALEAARWLRDRIALDGAPDDQGKAIPSTTCERALRPQLERTMQRWGISESELDADRQPPTDDDCDGCGGWPDDCDDCGPQW